MTDSQRAAIASRLRIARERAGLSQGQVAKMLHMHRPTVSEIEAARRAVTAEELTRFAKVYSVTVAWLASEPKGPRSDRVELAARELSKLKPSDVKRLMELLESLRREPEDK